MKDIKTIKLTIYNNQRIVIENYQYLFKISEEEMLVDDYSISGNNLKIRKMDEYHLEIHGQVMSIGVREND